MNNLTISEVKKLAEKLVNKCEFDKKDLKALTSLNYSEENVFMDFIREDASLLPFERVIKQHIFSSIIQQESKKTWMVNSLISLGAFYENWGAGSEDIRTASLFVQAYKMIASENEGTGFSALRMIGLDYKKVFSAWLLWWNEDYDYDLTVGKLEKTLKVVHLDTLSREALNALALSVLTDEERKIVFEESKSNPSLEGFDNFYRF